MARRWKGVVLFVGGTVGAFFCLHYHLEVVGFLALLCIILGYGMIVEYAYGRSDT